MSAAPSLLARCRLPTLLRVGAAAVACLSGVWAHQLARLSAEAGSAPASALLLAGCTIAGVAVGMSLLVEQAIAARVGDLRDATDQLARGRFDVELYGHPDDALGDIADALSSAAVRLAKLEAARAEFLASVSHELRTPLTVIRAALFTALRQCDPAEHRRLQLIDGEAARLQLQIDDLMTAASLDAGRLTLRTAAVDVLAAASEVLDRFSTMAEAAGVKLSLEDRAAGRLIANLDELRFGQLLGNLVSNAIAHAPPGTIIEVRVSPGGGDVAAVSVSNEGADIAAEDVPQLFAPFQQGRHPTGRLGLGLSIARELARLHGGDVELLSRAPLATFVVRLPAVHVLRPGTFAGAGA